MATILARIKRLFSEVNFRKLGFYYLIIFLLTILVLLPDLVYFIKNDVVNYAISGIFIVQALLFIPVFFFSRFLKVYYWALAILCALIPIMLVPVFYWNIQVSAEMLNIVLDTDLDEVMQLFGWKIILLVLGTFFFAWLFLKIASKLPSKIKWKYGLLISLIGILGYCALPVIRMHSFKSFSIILRNTYRTYYPFRLQSTFALMRYDMGNMERYEKNTRDFTYHAKPIDSTDTSRKIFVMVIGEASRADHWGINGYKKQTSPYVSSMQHLISFKDVVSGATMTHLSVPQLITRAEPEDYELHTKQKSILSAFDEAGFYSAWVSNQSALRDYGDIGMHFTDGDTIIYSGYGENESNFTGNYDNTVLPIIKQVINKHPKRNIFLIVHLIGSHWRYILRYPPSFQKFKPTSDRNRALMENPTLEEIINEYDNSILYTDYILKSISDILKSYQAESSFMFVPDHGENLGEDGVYFHSYMPSKATSKVPMFFWFNNAYAGRYPEIISNLRSNADKPVSSASSAFYTMIDVGRISISDFDSTKSLTRKSFVPGTQVVLGGGGKVYKYSELK